MFRERSKMTRVELHERNMRSEQDAGRWVNILSGQLRREMLREPTRSLDDVASDDLLLCASTARTDTHIELHKTSVSSVLGAGAVLIPYPINLASPLTALYKIFVVKPWFAIQ
jgi:hypothetical protein